MTSIKKSLGLISTTLLIASVLSVSSPYAVYAEDSQPDKVTAETKTNQVNVDASMRGNEPYIDATIATEQPVSQSAQATVMLQDANGNTITSWVYTMTPGQRRFTAWFDLTGLKSNDYRVAVSVQDKERWLVVNRQLFILIRLKLKNPQQAMTKRPQHPTKTTSLLLALQLMGSSQTWLQGQMAMLTSK